MSGPDSAEDRGLAWLIREGAPLPDGWAAPQGYEASEHGVVCTGSGRRALVSHTPLLLTAFRVDPEHGCVQFELAWPLKSGADSWARLWLSRGKALSTAELYKALAHRLESPVNSENSRALVSWLAACEAANASVLRAPDFEWVWAEPGTGDER